MCRYMRIYAAVFAWFLWFRLMKFLNEFSWTHLILSALRKAVGPLVGLFLVGFFNFFFLFSFFSPTPALPPPNTFPLCGYVLLVEEVLGGLVYLVVDV